jgi:hypothetical protein
MDSESLGEFEKLTLHHTFIDRIFDNNGHEHCRLLLANSIDSPMGLVFSGKGNCELVTLITRDKDLHGFIPPRVPANG